MTAQHLLDRLASVAGEHLPVPGRGATPERHRRLFAIAREDVSLAKLAEAHWDALAILAEAGRTPVPGALYAVWASEAPGKELSLSSSADGRRQLSGTRAFASGATLVDRALVTVAHPEPRLVEVDLRGNPAAITVDLSAWQADAFRLTRTGAVSFHAAPLAPDASIGEPGWYLSRSGFWHGACGPAACWAGGAAGLLDAALRSKRGDPHTLAHLAALHADAWALASYLDTAGREIDAAPADRAAAEIRALTVRHLVVETCTDMLRRFARAYGPQPLAMDGEVARRYAEVDLYMRQSHAERDLESLAHTLRKSL